MLFIGLLYLQLDVAFGATIAGIAIFGSRLLALYFNTSLPKFRFKS